MGLGAGVGAEVIPDDRIGADAEEFLAVGDAIAVGVEERRLGAVEE